MLDELIVVVLAQLRCVSLEEALMRTGMRVAICGYGNLCDPVFPTPDPTKKHYYLSRALDRQIVVEATQGDVACAAGACATGSRSILPTCASS